VTGPYQPGGLLQLKKIAALAEMARLPINPHAVGELGVGAGAGLHVCSTMPNLTDANQTHHQILADDTLAGPVLHFQRGKVDVPTGAGLGIELDWEKVEHFAELYTSHGQYFNF
jgi:L-alanine-DL-glutamate epimerase-like enolase superfamily enzyme